MGRLRSIYERRFRRDRDDSAELCDPPQLVIGIDGWPIGYRRVDGSILEVPSGRPVTEIPEEEWYDLRTGLKVWIDE